LSDFNGANEFSGFAGKTLAGVLALGTWSPLHDSNSGITSGTRDIVLCPNGIPGVDGCAAGTELGRYLIVVANQSDFSSCNSGSNCDYFKIKTVVAEASPTVPETGTISLLGVALMSLVGWGGNRGSRRKK
jgi:hypothetical protein